MDPLFWGSWGVFPVLGNMESNAVKPLDAKDTYPSTTAIIDAKGAREVANAVNILKEEKNVQPIGQEFVKELKTDEGSFVNYHCKLCDCRITDPTAKDQHIKGRRHRLAYNKKVNTPPIYAAF